MLEVCIEDTHGLDACLSTNVAQVELCSALSVGGLTPSAGLIKFAVNTPASVHVLIRPRAGNFNFSQNEVALMCDDVAFAVHAGVDGIVVGAATNDVKLDVSALRRLSNVAGPVNITLHRVIDTVDNPLDAMEQAIDMGFSTILTSGGKSAAQDGVRMLGELNNQANGRIEILAGGGLMPSAVARINQQTGITSFHSSCRQAQVEEHSCANNLLMLGFDTATTLRTDTGLIRQYQAAIKDLSNT